MALKVLHPELAHALGAERFLREIEVAANLSHPHILPLFDSGEAEGLLYYVMPYVEGESLRDRLRRETQLPVDDALQIAREVADALAYAHGQGVIHRDIKPENILLSGGHALVADFGIARALGQADGAHLTETGMAIGTAAYMSPEQASAASHIDGRSDVYSLGCVVYEMLAGEPPYTGPTAQAIIAKRFSDPVPRVRRLRPSVPEHVDQAVTRALAPVPADRFATAAEFARALQPGAHGGAAPGRRSDARQPRPVRRRRRVPVAGDGPRARHPHRPRRAVRLAAEPRGSGGRPAARRCWPCSRSRTWATRPTPTSPTAWATRSAASCPQLAGLAVIARASSNEYRHTNKPPQQIARELGADYLLTATVRWEKHPEAPAGYG